MQIYRIKILGFTLLVAGLALCGMGLWLLSSPAQYQAMARIELAQLNEPRNYDPVYIQTELEIIQSPLVLSNVVESLHLNSEWGKKYDNDNPLETAKAIKLLQEQMSLEPVRNTSLIKINFSNEDPNAAAKIANAIAKAYQDYRLEKQRQLTIGGIKALEEQYRKQEQEIRVVQTNVDLLREKFHPMIYRHRVRK